MRSGTIRQRNGHYFLRIYVGKKQRELALGSTYDLPSKAERERAADNIRLRLGVAGTGARVTLERFAEHWYLRVVDSRLRPSTAADYHWRFEKYIKERKEAKLPLWEYRTRDVQNLLNGIAHDHPNLSKASLQRIKALLSGIFRHSVNAGFREGNPVRDVLLPGREPVADSRKQPGVYDLTTVRAVLKKKLPAELKVAVAIAAYAGLRLAELKGLRWEDYDGESLTVRTTSWQGFENAPKSKASGAAVPVVPALAAVLNAYKKTYVPRTKIVEGAADGETINGVEVADTAMFRSELKALGRYHLPDAFTAVKSQWRGWHAFRRGLASTLFQLGAEDIVVQRILRHARVIVTRESYIKQFDVRVTEAMKRFGDAV